jgi:hypothetical protein
VVELWRDTAFLEMHVGAFTPTGTFQAAIEKLDHVVETGLTAIELMPVADFAGRRNWGYDGVLPYAPDSSYGRPDDLKALVDAAHARGSWYSLMWSIIILVRKGIIWRATRPRSSHPRTRPGATRSIIAVCSGHYRRPPRGPARLGG